MKVKKTCIIFVLMVESQVLIVRITLKRIACLKYMYWYMSELHRYFIFQVTFIALYMTDIFADSLVEVVSWVCFDSKLKPKFVKLNSGLSVGYNKFYLHILSGGTSACPLIPSTSFFQSFQWILNFDSAKIQTDQLSILCQNCLIIPT